MTGFPLDLLRAPNKATVGRRQADGRFSGDYTTLQHRGLYCTTADDGANTGLMTDAGIFSTAADFKFRKVYSYSSSTSSFQQKRRIQPTVREMALEPLAVTAKKTVLERSKLTSTDSRYFSESAVLL